MYAKELRIVVIEGGPGAQAITTESARGLFVKYTNNSRTGTHLVVWTRIGADGQVEEVARWNRPVNEKDEKAPTNAQPVASGALVEVGLYVVAHGKTNPKVSTIAGKSVYGLITTLQAGKIPRADKVSFVACSSGKTDEGAIEDTRKCEYNPTKHGLEVEELSFVSMFAMGYQTEYGSDKPLHVAGWESFVSVYHPNKEDHVPNNSTQKDTGRKYVSGHDKDSYTFMKPKSTSRTSKKRMFKWSFVDGKPKVERIDLATYKRSG